MKPRCVLFILLSLSMPAYGWAQGDLPHAEPANVGVRAEPLRLIEPMVTEAIEKGEIPGCVVLLAKDGHSFYRRAFGHRQLLPTRVPMTVDTIFDMASLTKPVATATSVMTLIEQGKLRLNDPIGMHVPEFSQNGKEGITVFQCLTHQAGFVPDSPLSEYNDPDQIWPKLFALGTDYEPGSKFVYSDVGFQVLGKLVEKVSGQTLDAYSQDHIFRPLGMHTTRFLPPAEWSPRIAPTERRNGQWMVGQVHDPRAFAMGGVAGHAGLFSTADDMAFYGQTMLDQGRCGDQHVLSEAVVNVMTKAYRSGSFLRGLGWDKQSKYSSNRSELYSESAFGHGGFTGTVLWIDSQLQLIVVVLSNRLHPDGEGTVNRLAGRIGTVAASAVLSRSKAFADHCIGTEPKPSIHNDANKAALAGIDVLQRDEFAALAGRRVGLILNHTAKTQTGAFTSTVLHESPSVDLVCLFSPEHGIHGALEQSRIDDTKDTATGLPVYSLYGERQSPDAKHLAEVDTLVFDIQDIGTRFYTYISTMGNAMRVAADHGLRFVVLDRPNPIGGTIVDGPVLDKSKESFVGFHPIPVQHGMTVGELAKMFREELRLQLDLHVIPVEGWNRSQLWDETGMTWTDPSPNMRTPHQAILYPGIGLLETTNLSVGRGTDTPFQLVGAPWIQGRRLANRINEMNIPGIRCAPIEFRPTASKFKGQTCHGVRFLITNRKRFRPVPFGLAVACAIRDVHGDAWKLADMARLLCDDNVLELLQLGVSASQIEAAYQAELSDFLIRRNAHLLYE